jgi:orotidine-5'-phosphate decarboxylase
MSIIEKYNQRVNRIHSSVCVGLDCDWEKIPNTYKKLSCPQFEFNKFIIEETHQYVAAFKPNSAFYEARGDQGIRELKMTMAYLQEKYPDIVTILDAKRGDLENTNKSYAAFAFDWLGFDAITLNPYCGREALAPFLERQDKASIILCRTSNPGARELQDVLVEGKPLWQKVASLVANEWNSHNNCLLVVGATYPEEMRIIRQLAPQMTFLVPGVGAQGGDLKSIIEAGQPTKKLIINSSRGIIFSDNPASAAKKLRDEINRFTL